MSLQTKIQKKNSFIFSVDFHGKITALNHKHKQLSFSECMVVPDDWSVVHTRFIVNYTHGVFCGRILVGGEIHKRYVICVSSKLHDIRKLRHAQS
jgi:hypothetical protein